MSFFGPEPTVTVVALCQPEKYPGYAEWVVLAYEWASCSRD